MHINTAAVFLLINNKTLVKVTLELLKFLVDLDIKCIYTSSEVFISPRYWKGGKQVPSNTTLRPFIDESYRLTIISI